MDQSSFEEAVEKKSQQEDKKQEFKRELGIQLDKDHFIMKDEKSGFSWDLRPHPMCIPHIVSKILGFLNIPELKSVRLVNTQYNEIASYNLSRKEVVTFTKASHLVAYLASKKLILEPIPTISTSTTSSTPSTSPQTTPTLDTTTENENAAMDNRIQRTPLINHTTAYRFSFDPSKADLIFVEQFFDNFGPFIRELHYETDLLPFKFPKRLAHMGEIWGRTPLQNLETLSFKMKWGVPLSLFEPPSSPEIDIPSSVTLPSVKRLVIDILVAEREADRTQTFLRQLLQLLPNLEEIEIPGNKKYFDDYVNVILARLILSPELSLNNLSRLNFCLALDEGQIRSLAEKGFGGLRTLILDFADIPCLPFPSPPTLNEDIDANNNNRYAPVMLPYSTRLLQSLSTLFQQLAPTLEKLHFCFPYSTSHSLHKFLFPQRMDKLGYLALGGFYGSVQILDNLPTLRKLDLWNVRFYDFNYEKKGAGLVEEVTGCGSTTTETSLERSVPNQYLGITTVIGS